eukprot:3517838-Prymnesium_polylepis.1
MTSNFLEVRTFLRTLVSSLWLGLAAVRAAVSGTCAWECGGSVGTKEHEQPPTRPYFRLLRSFGGQRSVERPAPKTRRTCTGCLFHPSCSRLRTCYRVVVVGSVSRDVAMLNSEGGLSPSQTKLTK